MFNWNKDFPSTSVDEKVAIFNRTFLLNILDKPPWFNGKIKKKTKKTTAYKYSRQNGNDACWQHHLKFLQDRLNNSIESSEEKYYNKVASKLQNTKKLQNLAFAENILKQSENTTDATVIRQQSFYFRFAT